MAGTGPRVVVTFARVLAVTDSGGTQKSHVRTLGGPWS